MESKLIGSRGLGDVYKRQRKHWERNPGLFGHRVITIRARMSLSTERGL